MMLNELNDILRRKRQPEVGGAVAELLMAMYTNMPDDLMSGGHAGHVKTAEWYIRNKAQVEAMAKRLEEERTHAIGNYQELQAAQGRIRALEPSVERLQTERADVVRQLETAAANILATSRQVRDANRQRDEAEHDAQGVRNELRAIFKALEILHIDPKMVATVAQGAVLVETVSGECENALGRPIQDGAMPIVYALAEFGEAATRPGHFSSHPRPEAVR